MIMTTQPPGLTLHETPAGVMDASCARERYGATNDDVYPYRDLWTGGYCAGCDLTLPADGTEGGRVIDAEAYEVAMREAIDLIAQAHDGVSAARRAYDRVDDADQDAVRGAQLLIEEAEAEERAQWEAYDVLLAQGQRGLARRLMVAARYHTWGIDTEAAEAALLRLHALRWATGTRPPATDGKERPSRAALLAGAEGAVRRVLSLTMDKSTIDALVRAALGVT